MTEKELTQIIIGSAIEEHKILGPGLLRSMYQESLFIELKERGVEVQCEVVVPASYKKHDLRGNYRIDLLVENCIIVETKTVSELEDVHTAQILTYLKLTNNRVGLLINFNVALLRDGLKRVLNGYLFATTHLCRLLHFN